ncbi:hypothetical protein AB0B15_11835 [Streptomyces sp. NPDC045456]|uniref:hypothetical protein n=1 Tax=Streptomyces sp. NPDC045456 TaxID=3155254 RepID=UPI0033F99242
MLDGADDVMGVITEQIEAHFDMSFDELRRAVTAAPQANREATEIVHWHGLLAESQHLLEKAEVELVAELETQPDELDDLAMDKAHRVNAAVAARDGRAMVVRWLLDPVAAGKQGLAAERQARLNRAARKGPAVQTSAPTRTATAPTPAAGRGVHR